MAEARLGRIIIYSACLGRMSGPGNTGGLAPYRISKAGVNALVRNLAHETVHGTRGLLVDAVCPNHTRTDMGGPGAPLEAPEAVAGMRKVLAEVKPADSGSLIHYDGRTLPW